MYLILRGFALPLLVLGRLSSQRVLVQWRGCCRETNAGDSWLSVPRRSVSREEELKGRGNRSTLGFHPLAATLTSGQALAPQPVAKSPTHFTWSKAIPLRANPGCWRGSR